MLDWLKERARISPKKLALSLAEQSYTYEALNKLTESYAIQLRQAGIGPGKRVAVLLPNSLNYVCTVHALLRLGATLVPLNTRLNLQELRYQCQEASCSYLVCSQMFLTQAKKLELPYWNVDEGLSSTQQAQVTSINLDLEQTFALMFTSGTTGKPKAVRLSLGNIFYSATASAYRLGVLPDDLWLCALPLYHIGGLSILLRSTLYGTAVRLHKTFDTGAINSDLIHNSISLISLVPTMLYRLLEHKTSPWNKRLRLVLIGGSSLPLELLKRCQQEALPLATTYGLSEASSQVATALPELVFKKPGTVGQTLMFTRLKILGDKGQTLKANQAGEIYVSGPNLMKGYDKSTALNPGEWLATGDIGYLDDDQDLFVLQRRHDLIISGGENIYPKEVEDTLLQHPDVKEACVVGLAHPEWGEQVAAAMVLKKACTKEALTAYAKQNLASYKLPRHIIFLDELPLTASGKVHRGKVKALFA